MAKLTPEESSMVRVAVNSSGTEEEALEKAKAGFARLDEENTTISLYPIESLEEVIHQLFLKKTT